MTGSSSACAESVKQELLGWLEAAVAEGWLPEAEIRFLESMETRGAERLFEDSGSGRPLTVGFFGGTGVGKSSLLNRLVGESLARVGVERPTSTSVTLYVHEQFPIRDLGSDFPIERVHVSMHNRDEYRNVVWVDMPDIDSVARHNRELVFEWLPCIDWLVYVVSPEKYRDDAGWRVLEQYGYRHHWLFVINHWDQGEKAQYEDFKRLLTQAGIHDPVVLRTNCGEADVDDDFDAMAETINHAIAEHGLARLQQVGERARLADLLDACGRYAAKLGEPEAWRSFINTARPVLDDKLDALNRYLVDEASIQAAGVPERGAAEPPSGREPGLPGLVDDYVQDWESITAVEAGELPASPIESRIKPIAASLPGRLAEVFQDGFRKGMTRPGNAVQRTAAAVLGKLVYGLPVIAGAGVAYIVLIRYRSGLSGTGEFLGFEFLTHSLMVLGLAALLPYLLARLLRPSVRRSIVKHVRAGLDALRTALMGEFDDAMKAVMARRRSLVDELNTIRARIESQLGH